LREPFIDELKNSSVIREVHVYGNVVNIGEKSKGNVQHLGLGRKMIKIAEDISKRNGFRKISVISAVGTRQYYRKLQFIDGVMYMSKETSY